MREWWANVYHADGWAGTEAEIGNKFTARSDASRYRGSSALYRLHVRLKPEGAPRRYASERERMWWEVAGQAPIDPPRFG